MKNNLIDILCCPQCFSDLELKEEIIDNNQIIEGILKCDNCHLSFDIKEGIPIFGVKSSDKNDRFEEIIGENEWVYNVNDIDVHIDFAKGSSEDGEKIIKKVNKTFGNKKFSKKLRVLDLGSGWGCFQSWQFAKEDYDVIAVDLCPEFIMSSDNVVNDCYFERIIADCTILPFKSQIFDIIICKELFHHLGNPIDLLNEMYRLCSDDGMIIIFEPCTSMLLERIKSNSKTSEISKIGIKHYSYNYYNYLDYMRLIIKDIQVKGKIQIIDEKNHKIVNKIQKFIIQLSKISFLKEIIIKLHLILIGGSIEIMGIKKGDYDIKYNKRKIIPLSIVNQNLEQTTFYRNVLIPPVFEIFYNSRNKYIEIE